MHRIHAELQAVIALVPVEDVADLPLVLFREAAFSKP
jgi:hypothetical protein